jgi:hypothetical protein
MVADVPVPAIAPGFIIQLPAGKPFNITLPVASAHVGWVRVPTTGAVGVAGAALMTTLTDAADIQPDIFDTVKLFVPATRPDIVVDVPVPVTAPGLMVQVPAGKPLNITLPVGRAQVG